MTIMSVFLTALSLRSTVGSSVDDIDVQLLQTRILQKGPIASGFGVAGDLASSASQTLCLNLHSSGWTTWDCEGTGFKSAAAPKYCNSTNAGYKRAVAEICCAAFCATKTLDLTTSEGQTSCLNKHSSGWTNWDCEGTGGKSSATPTYCNSTNAGYKKAVAENCCAPFCSQSKPAMPAATNSTDKKKCVVKGDPHVKTWETPESDGARLGLYGTYADYWLVNTPELKVMGRIGSVKKFEMGVVKGIAVSGSLVGDKILEVPTENNGPITFDGTPITTFPWEGGGMKITVGNGQNINRYGMAKPGIRPNTYTVTMDKAEIIFNQDVFQHLQIEVDSSLAAADAGLCNHECNNWFECQDPICDLTKSLFSTEHPQCGEEVDRRPCNRLRKKLASRDCNDKYGVGAHGASIQNCIEDCCADRDQCPDRGKGDGMATCMLFGDPHIKGFDAQDSDKSSYNPMGTHWLVNSEFVKIQANYATVPQFNLKAQMNGIAITGALVGDALPGGGHPILYFHPPSEGGVDLDGTKIMKCQWVRDCIKTKSPLFYEDPNGHYNITYGKAPDVELLLTDRTRIAQRDNMYSVEFAIGAKIVIHQGSGHSIWMSISSAILSDVSGECGNFNGNPDDDGHSGALDAGDSSALCAKGSDIFLPNGEECKKVMIEDFTCTKAKELWKFKKQCITHFNLKRLHSDPAAAKILLDCQVDCCKGGTCPGNKGVSDEDY